MKNHNFRQINNYLTKTYRPLEVINMDSLYTNIFNTIFSKEAFQDAINALCESSNLHKISFPYYCIPKQTSYGLIEASKQQIIAYFLGLTKIQGVYSSYRLFNKYHLTTQISKSVRIYSNLAPSEGFEYENIFVKKLPFDITESNYQLVEILEILKQRDSIEELSECQLKAFLNKYLEGKTVSDMDQKVLNVPIYSSELIKELEHMLSNHAL